MSATLTRRVMSVSGSATGDVSVMLCSRDGEDALREPGAGGLGMPGRDAEGGFTQFPGVQPVAYEEDEDDLDDDDEDFGDDDDFEEGDEEFEDDDEDFLDDEGDDDLDEDFDSDDEDEEGEDDEDL